MRSWSAVKGERSKHLRNSLKSPRNPLKGNFLSRYLSGFQRFWCVAEISMKLQIFSPDIVIRLFLFPNTNQTGRKSWLMQLYRGGQSVACKVKSWKLTSFPKTRTLFVRSHYHHQTVVVQRKNKSSGSTVQFWGRCPLAMFWPIWLDFTAQCLQPV